VRQILAAGESGKDPRLDRRIDGGDQPADVIPRGSLPGFAAVTHEQHDLVRRVSRRFDGEVGAAADAGAEGDEQLS
jgi:hypothetical protein